MNKTKWPHAILSGIVSVDMWDKVKLYFAHFCTEKKKFFALFGFNFPMIHCMSAPARPERLRSCITLNALIKLVHTNMTVLTFPSRLFWLCALCHMVPCGVVAQAAQNAENSHKFSPIKSGASVWICMTCHRGHMGTR